MKFSVKGLKEYNGFYVTCMVMGDSESDDYKETFGPFYDSEVAKLESFIMALNSLKDKAVNVTKDENLLYWAGEYHKNLSDPRYKTANRIQFEKLFSTKRKRAKCIYNYEIFYWADGHKLDVDVEENAPNIVEFSDQT